MSTPDSFDVLMGIFRFCPQRNIPADSRALQKALFKIGRTYPELFCPCLFFEDGRSKVLAEDFDELLLNGMFGVCGEKLETLEISDELIEKFDKEVILRLTDDQVKRIKRVGNCLPKMLKKHESQRYRILIG
jgi:hypothetical protein